MIVSVTANKIVKMFHPQYSLKIYANSNSLRLNYRPKQHDYKPTVDILHLESDGKIKLLRRRLKVPYLIADKISNIRRSVGSCIICITIDLNPHTRLESTGDTYVYYRQRLEIIHTHTHIQIRRPIDKLNLYQLKTYAQDLMLDMQFTYKNRYIHAYIHKFIRM
jgi:hypothetical protein